MHWPFDFVNGPQVHEIIRASPDWTAFDGPRRRKPSHRGQGIGNIIEMR